MKMFIQNFLQFKLRKKIITIQFLKLSEKIFNKKNIVDELNLIIILVYPTVLKYKIEINIFPIFYPRIK